MPFGSLVVQRDKWDTSWGPKKLFFLIREIDDAAIAGASVESCRFVVPRSLGGRAGSVQYMCNRLRRLRRRFQHKIHLAKMHLNPDVSTTKCQSFRSRALWGAPSPGACGVGDHPTPDLSLSESGSRSASEKVNNLVPMAPVPVKNVNYPRAPSSRRSGLVGPHTTPAIVNYKYMTSTL